MAEVTVDVRGITEVRSLLSEFPDSTFKAATAAMRVATVNAKRTVQGKFRPYSGQGSDNLQNRSGGLRSSIRRETSGLTLANLFSRLYSDSPFASIHEEGGTINARNKYMGVPGGPYLNIPTPSNLSGNGIQIFSPGEIFSAGGFMVRSKAGKYLVMSKGGTPMFVLVRSVTIKPRLGMEQAVLDEVPTLLSTLNDELLKGL